MRKGCYAPKLHFFFAFHTHICEKYSFGANFLIKKLCVGQMYIIHMFLFSSVRPKSLGRQKKYIKSRIDIFGGCFTPGCPDKTAILTIFGENGFRIKKTSRKSFQTRFLRIFRKESHCMQRKKYLETCENILCWPTDPYIPNFDFFTNFLIKKVGTFLLGHTKFWYEIFFERGASRAFQKCNKKGTSSTVFTVENYLCQCLAMFSYFLTSFALWGG